MSALNLEKSIFLNAKPEKVWAYLTDPEKIGIWFHKPKATLDLGPFEMGKSDAGGPLVRGEVLLAEPFSRLEYTFFIPSLGVEDSKVVWTLEAIHDGTKLSLTHSGLPQQAEAFGLPLALDEGWDKHLGRLRDDVKAATS